MAKTMGFLAIPKSISGVNIFPADNPKNTSVVDILNEFRASQRQALDELLGVDNE